MEDHKYQKTNNVHDAMHRLLDEADLPDHAAMRAEAIIKEACDTAYRLGVERAAQYVRAEHVVPRTDIANAMVSRLAPTPKEPTR